MQASVIAARGLNSAVSGLCSAGAQVQLLRRTLFPPEPELKPVSPALAAGFFTTEPPGKPSFLQ